LRTFSTTPVLRPLIFQSHISIESIPIALTLTSQSASPIPPTWRVEWARPVSKVQLFKGNIHFLNPAARQPSTERYRALRYRQCIVAVFSGFRTKLRLSSDHMRVTPNKVNQNRFCPLLNRKNIKCHRPFFWDTHWLALSWSPSSSFGKGSLNGRRPYDLDQDWCVFISMIEQIGSQIMNDLNSKTDTDR
jgi:hypothetical protein